MSRAGPG